MLIIPKPKKKKKNYTVLEFGKLEYRRNKIFCILFIKGTRAWYIRVLCCMVLEFTKLEYHIIFFNRTNSNSVVPQWQNWWGTRVSETRVLEKVVVCHLFPKQCFFAKNFQKMWYLAILALFRIYWGYKVAAKKLYLLFKILCMDHIRHGKFKVFEIFNFFWHGRF